MLTYVFQGWTPQAQVLEVLSETYSTIGRTRRSGRRSRPQASPARCARRRAPRRPAALDAQDRAAWRVTGLTDGYSLRVLDPAQALRLRGYAGPDAELAIEVTDRRGRPPGWLVRVAGGRASRRAHRRAGGGHPGRRGLAAPSSAPRADHPASAGLITHPGGPPTTSTRCCTRPWTRRPRCTSRSLQDRALTPRAGAEDGERTVQSRAAGKHQGALMSGSLSPFPLVSEGAHYHPVRTLQDLLNEHGHGLVVDGPLRPADGRGGALVRAGQGPDRRRGCWAAHLVRGDRHGPAGQRGRRRARRPGGVPVPQPVRGPDQGARGRRDLRSPRRTPRYAGSRQALHADIPSVAVDGIVGPVTWQALVSGMLSS